MVRWAGVAREGIRARRRPGETEKEKVKEKEKEKEKEKGVEEDGGPRRCGEGRSRGNVGNAKLRVG